MFSLRRLSARRRVATHKMKQIKQSMSKEGDDVDNEEENEELFGDIGEDDLSVTSAVCTVDTKKIITIDKSLSHTKTLYCVWSEARGHIMWRFHTFG